MKGILVWHQGAIGDLALSLPAVCSVKKHFRGRSLHLIARSDFFDIISANGLADEVSSNEKGLYADFFSEAGVSGCAADFLGEFDAAFVFMRRRQETFMKNFRRHIPTCFHVSTIPPDGGKEHVALFQLRQLAGKGIPPSMPPHLGIVRTHAEIDALEPIISIHPGSGGESKRWDLRGFLDLIEILSGERRYRFFILLGPAEAQMQEECERYVAARNVRAEIVSGRPLTFVASVLKASALYIGNDSGITHLASALGTAVVAIFGPTDPAVWGPLGGNVSIIKPFCPVSGSQGSFCLTLEDVKVEEVAEVSRRLLAAGRA